MESKRQDLPDYRGWKMWDRGENSHPITGRFCAQRMGVDFCLSSLEQLKKTIDRRILEYPASGGA